MAQPDDDGKRASDVTRVIARQVARQRGIAGMNQTQLGAKMAALRPNWSRSTVAKLENNNRESVTVEDLFALAVALGVPPTWLLVDPEHGVPTPIAGDIDRDPWTTLLWLTGQQPLEDKPGSAWDGAAQPLEELRTIAMMLDTHDEWVRKTTAFLDDAIDLNDSRREGEVRILRALARAAQKLIDWGYTLPPIPPGIQERAAELGIDLPGAEG